jgi:hypothetical protein
MKPKVEAGPSEKSISSSPTFKIQAVLHDASGLISTSLSKLLRNQPLYRFIEAEFVSPFTFAVGIFMSYLISP